MSPDDSNHRFFPFSECMNFRHMGGYPTEDGRTTRADRLYRSCIFELNEPADRERFESLGITTVFDFRVPDERERRPLTLEVTSPPEIVELDIAAGNMGSYLRELKGEHPPAGAIKVRMTSWYEEMADTAMPQYQNLFQDLAENEGASMVLCNTGKDRSGMAAGLILAALGVSDQTIMEDFLLSAWAYRDVESARKRYLGGHPIGGDTAYLSEVFTVYPEYIDAFRAKAEAKAGSFSAYLEEHLGLDNAALKNLRARLTE